MKTTPFPSDAPILCFGEVLWDVLPKGIFLGGAPVNVAYHLRQLGARPVPVSAVGRDFLGAEIVRRLKGWDIPAYGVAANRRPTGTVQAALDAEGVAHYTIERGVAWDRIGAKPVLALARKSRAVVYGSLALREAHNRRELERLLAAAPQAVKVCDINLRAPFTEPGVVTAALRRADLIKINDDELRRIAGAPAKKSPEAGARALARRTGCGRVCVTAGPAGAGILWDGAWFWEKGRKVAVRDTIGAGDAFLAALLHGLLIGGLAPARALAGACRLGEYVAGQDGATPAHPAGRR